MWVRLGAVVLEARRNGVHGVRSETVLEGCGEVRVVSQLGGEASLRRRGPATAALWARVAVQGQQRCVARRCRQRWI